MQKTPLMPKIAIYAIPGILKNNNPDSIIRVIEGRFGVNLRLNTRKREILEPRQIAMFTMKHRTALSLAQIGVLCGCKDHATVLHACKTVQNLLDTNKKYKLKYAEIFEFYGLLE